MFNCSHDQFLSKVHRQRERLQHEIVAVTIDDHARKTVAFAPYQAAQFCVDVSPVPVFGSLLDAAPAKIEIEILPSSRETARNDLRFRIVNRAPNQMIFAVLERNHIAIRGISENLEHFAGKHPVVPMQNSRSRFDDNACHKRIQSQTLNYSVIPSAAKRSREWSGPGKPRHRRGRRRLSKREVSESNLFKPEMSRLCLIRRNSNEVK